MKFPSPSYRAYLKSVTTALLIIAILQYTGIFGAPEAINFVYLADMAFGISISTYLLTVILENISWLSRWEQMVQDSE